jgi:hypothetical protein
MSEHHEIQKSRDAYLAAREAAERIRPSPVEVVYKKGACPVLDGLFIYDPETGSVLIARARGNRAKPDGINIDAEDIPALIRALRDFFE